MDMGLDIEEAALDEEPLWGLNEDVKKYYDTMVRPILWKAAEALGMPEWLTDSQNRFYDQLKRMFKYGRALGPMHRTWGQCATGVCDVAYLGQHRWIRMGLGGRVQG